MKDLLVAYLDDSSSQFLSEVMASAPFDHLDADKWFVSIYASKTDLPESIVDVSATYECIPVKVDAWYDPATAMTNLVMVIKSKELDNRHLQIAALGYEPVVNLNSYVAHINLVFGFPALSRSYRRFIQSLSMTFNSRSGITINLKGETLLDSGGYIPNVEGQEYFVKKHSVPK